jgi:hypothetical protein
MKDKKNMEPINHPSQCAAAFIRKLTEMVEHLASKEIVVSSLHVDGSNCWQLQATRGAETVRYEAAISSGARRDFERDTGPEVVRVFWDGRDGLLTIEASPTRLLSAPNEWKLECGKAFDLKARDAILQFVKDYLIKRLGK